MTTSIKWPSWPQYGQEEYAAVEKVIRSNQLFAAKEVECFEEQFSTYIGTKFGVGLGNATQGLHLALAALNIGISDEVIVTPYSWISTASCILMQNAVPVFCDIEPESFGMDPQKLEQKITERTKAIMVVHMFGYPSKIRELQAVAQKYGIPLIEDASHAHGASVNGQKVGTFGVLSVFSLHQRKSLSVGDGGIICTDNQEIRDKIYRLRSFGDFELSYNYRMTEFAGALGQVGLRKLDRQNNQRIQNARFLTELLKDLRPGLEVVCVRENEEGVFYAVLIRVNTKIEHFNKKLLVLQGAGIPIRKTWEPLHLHPHFNPPNQSPARGVPWQDPRYNGIMKNKTFADLDLPIVEKYCPHRLLEFYVHPPTGLAELEVAAKMLKREFLI
jgi:perosamine synthetase